MQVIRKKLQTRWYVINHRVSVKTADKPTMHQHSWLRLSQQTLAHFASRNGNYFVTVAKLVIKLDPHHLRILPNVWAEYLLKVRWKFATASVFGTHPWQLPHSEHCRTLMINMNLWVFANSAGLKSQYENQ